MPKNNIKFKYLGVTIGKCLNKIKNMNRRRILHYFLRTYMSRELLHKLDFQTYI